MNKTHQNIKGILFFFHLKAGANLNTLVDTFFYTSACQIWPFLIVPFAQGFWLFKSSPLCLTSSSPQM